MAFFPLPTFKLKSRTVKASSRCNDRLLISYLAMSSQDPNKAMFSFITTDFERTLRGPFCVECMNKKQASHPKMFYLTNKEEGGLPIYMHALDEKVVYKINELVYLNGSRTPFLFRNVPKDTDLLLMSCVSRTCSISFTSSESDNAAKQLVYVNNKGEGITVERIQNELMSLFSLPESKSHRAPSATFDNSTAAEARNECNRLSDDKESSNKATKREKKGEQRRLARECELDCLMQKFLMDKNEVDLENQRYGRSFLFCVRDIEKEFERTPCPLTLEELIDSQIDPVSIIHRKRLAFMANGVISSDVPFLNGYNKEDCSDRISLEKVEEQMLYWRITIASGNYMTHVNAVAAKEIEDGTLYCEWCDKSTRTSGSLFMHCVSKKHLKRVHSSGLVFSHSKDHSRALKLFKMASQAATKDRQQIPQINLNTTTSTC